MTVDGPMPAPRRVGPPGGSGRIGPALAVVVLVALAAGCAADPPVTSPVGTARPVGAGPPGSANGDPDRAGGTTRPAGPASDADAAGRAVVGAGDLPGAWREIPRPPAGPDDPPRPAVCSGSDGRLADLFRSTATVPGARSADLVAGDGERRAEHDVVLLATEEVARAALAGFADPAMADCLRRMVAAGGGPAGPEVSVAHRPAEAGDRIDVAVTWPGPDGAPAHLWLSFVRVGRALSILSVSGPGPAVPESLDPLAAAAAERVRRVAPS